MVQSQKPGPGGEPPDTRVGLKAVELGLLTDVQLGTVLRDLAGQPSPPPLSDVLVSRGLLTRIQVEGLQSGGLGAQRIGKYRLLRELGRGGMGIVHEAEDDDLKRRCALKTMLEGDLSDPTERAVEEERFIREARLCANLPRHPGIVGVYEAGVVEGRRLLAMELIEGRQFQEWRKSPGVTLRQQIQVLKEAAEAVAHAHAHGVIHRDLKPSNILVDPAGHPHVTDFGLAKRSRETSMLSLTASGMIVGTPAYMSPEQAEARDEVGPASDQWALGVMLYEILADRLPFRGDTAVEVLMKTVKEPVVPPTQVLQRANGGVDERLESICLRALRKDPKERFPDVREFADGLGSWVQGAAAPGAARKRRNWPLVAGAAVLVAVVIGLLLRPSGGDPGAVQALVVDGRRLLEQKNYADALIAFGRALAQDSAHAGALAGKREVERLLGLGVDAAVTIRARIDEDGVAAAVALLEGVEGGRLSEAARAELRGALRKKMDGLWPGLRDRALAAKLRGDKGAVDTLTRELDAWKREDLSRAFRDALAAAKPPVKEGLPAGVVERYTLTGHDNGVTALAFSPDGRRLYSGSFLNYAVLWELGDSVKEIEKGRLAERTVSAAYSPDGRWLASGMSGGAVVLRDTSSGAKRTLSGHTLQVLGLAFSPDSRRLFSCSTDGSVRRWRVADGASEAILEGHDAGAMALALAPDGKTAAAGSAEGRILLWDVDAGRLLRTLTPAEGRINSLAFAPDGKQLLSGSETGDLSLWDTERWTSRSFGRHEARVAQVAWSPDGRWIASAAGEPNLRLWEAATGAVRGNFFNEGGWFAATFSADSRLLAGGTYDWKARVFDLTGLRSK